MTLRDDERLEIGRKLKELRSHAGLSQAELARRSGIHVNMLRNLEHGRNEPSVITAVRLVRVLAPHLSSKSDRASGADLLAHLVSHVRSFEEQVNEKWDEEAADPESRLFKISTAEVVDFDFERKVQLLELLGLLPNVRSRRGGARGKS